MIKTYEMHFHYHNNEVTYSIGKGQPVKTPQTKEEITKEMQTVNKKT